MKESYCKGDKVMDLTFRTEEGTFNCRACAVILSEGKILTKCKTKTLAEQEIRCYTLPGGRVMMGEDAEHTIVREMQEELGVNLKLVRPLWLNQAFFTEEASGCQYHELAIYFLMDVAGTELLSSGETFVRQEGDRVHCFEWLPVEQLQKELFKPEFLKKAILDLPKGFTLHTEREEA